MRLSLTKSLHICTTAGLSPGCTSQQPPACLSLALSLSPPHTFASLCHLVASNGRTLAPALHTNHLRPQLSLYSAPLCIPHDPLSCLKCLAGTRNAYPDAPLLFCPPFCGQQLAPSRQQMSASAAVGLSLRPITNPTSIQSHSDSPLPSASANQPFTCPAPFLMPLVP